MTEDEMKGLRRGDLIRHVLDHKSVIVDANYGGRVTAVRTFDVTHPNEWILVYKADYKTPEEVKEQEGK